MIILWDVMTGINFSPTFAGYENDDSSDSWNYVWVQPRWSEHSLLPTTIRLIVLWDVATGSEIHTEFERDTRNFAFSGDGQRAFSGSRDGTYHLMGFQQWYCPAAFQRSQLCNGPFRYDC